MAGIDQLGVDLIGNDQDVMLDRQFRDLADYLGGRHRAGWVVGRDHDEHARLVGDAFLDLVHVQREIVLLEGRHRDRHAAAEMHGGVIGGEARRGDQNLVALLHQAEHGQHDAFLHTCRDDDLIRGVIQPVFGLQVVADRLTQLRQAGGAGVMVLVVIERLFGGRDDMRGCVKIRVAPAKRDHVVQAGRDLEHPGAERAVFLDDPGGGAVM